MYPRTKSLIVTHRESTARFAKENDCIAHYTNGNSRHFQSVRYTCTEETFILIKLKYPNVIETYSVQEKTVQHNIE